MATNIDDVLSKLAAIHENVKLEEDRIAAIGNRLTEVLQDHKALNKITEQIDERLSGGGLVLEGFSYQSVAEIAGIRQDSVKKSLDKTLARRAAYSAILAGVA